MAETEEDWVRLAMGDACLVADLLLRLLRDPPPSSRSWLDWTVRGRRTRPQPKNHDGFPKKEEEEAAAPPEHKAEQARASPSTPLSWSGGGASEESPSPPDDCSAPRSKAPLASGAPTTTASAALTVPAGKRPRQKKRSLFELKEEESLLWKERQSLEQELASLRLRVEKERATNESLKRLKASMISTKPGQRSPQSHNQQRDTRDLEVTPQQPRGPHGCSGQNKAEAPEKAQLPDLNLPPEE
ncbi:hypothetical protein MLD38_008005 [Melastoma candidum]|uniref:Uncharacterized protein n=1 Tax=Melastoma candidum TaxID=119954 RepID=A0ACB9RS37_9MYRT|nr:hypothetical protein MLD38_008005 [Melastoma candidum]